MEHRKPKTASRKLDPEQWAAFIAAYDNLLNHCGDDEAMLFAHAAHPPLVPKSPLSVSASVFNGTKQTPTLIGSPDASRLDVQSMQTTRKPLRPRSPGLSGAMQLR